MPGPPAELPAWPRVFTPPAKLLGWLEQQQRLHQKDPVAQCHLRTLRWLVLAELDRTAPEPAPKPDFLTP